MASADERHMRAALALATRGLGRTSPNPMVGAVLVKGRKVIGEGWHRWAGSAHAEVAAIRDARRGGYDVNGATFYVTLEPCCTTGRTPPCTEAIINAGIRRVVVGAKDPNSNHAGNGFRILRRAGIEVVRDVLAAESERLNAAFNHWIIHGTPLVTVKAAMALDGKIATASGESKWITGPEARREGLRLRHEADAILVGVETVLADNPSLRPRGKRGGTSLRRVILDSKARTPLDAKVVSDKFAHLTTVIVTTAAPPLRANRLAKQCLVTTAPVGLGGVDLGWVLGKFGGENVTSLLVEGGGAVNASFLEQGLAQRVAFFYAPKILGGMDARPAVAGLGAESLAAALQLADVEWREVGRDLMLTARVVGD